jgi:tRNA (cmo5U34)-methyltransferase
MHRERLMRQVYNALNPGGCVILVEKVLGESSHLNRLFIQHYYEMKRTKGYSEMEISQKREALENVLIPYRLTENLDLLAEIGFSEEDTFFKWYNFCGIIAVK